MIRRKRSKLIVIEILHQGALNRSTLWCLGVDLIHLTRLIHLHGPWVILSGVYVTHRSLTVAMLAVRRIWVAGIWVILVYGRRQVEKLVVAYSHEGKIGRRAERGICHETIARLHWY